MGVAAKVIQHLPGSAERPLGVDHPFGDAATLVMETIEAHVQGFFVQALQLDPRTLRLEAK